MVAALVALWPTASVTLTVKLDVPAVVAVPASAPVDAFSVIPPAGSLRSPTRCWDLSRRWR